MSRHTKMWMFVAVVACLLTVAPFVAVAEQDEAHDSAASDPILFSVSQEEFEALNEELAELQALFGPSAYFGPTHLEPDTPLRAPTFIELLEANYGPRPVATMPEMEAEGQPADGQPPQPAHFPEEIRKDVKTVTLAEAREYDNIGLLLPDSWPAFIPGHALDQGFVDVTTTTYVYPDASTIVSIDSTNLVIPGYVQIQQHMPSGQNHPALSFTTDPVTSVLAMATIVDGRPALLYRRGSTFGEGLVALMWATEQSLVYMDALKSTISELDVLRLANALRTHGDGGERGF